MKPRAPALDRRTAMWLAATEYQRCAELLRSLDSREWAAATACPAWDVRQMAAHMLGMVEMAASIREGSRQRRAATVNGNLDIDRLTALQVDERSSWSGQVISDKFAARAPKAVRGRRMTPGFIRRRTMIGGVINGIEEPWMLGYLIDVILTRDPWMHRLDICTALGRTPHLTADHDGVIVADVVSEWADRHGKDFTLDLTGPAGGTWTAGAAGPRIELEATGFCRVIAKRPGPVDFAELMGTEVPF
ncbi:MAG: maleylpyruvate isomerase family mycothiol-dependent enzyme [Streptosporangiaceae bacterium]